MEPIPTPQNLNPGQDIPTPHSNKSQTPLSSSKPHLHTLRDPNPTFKRAEPHFRKRLCLLFPWTLEPTPTFKLERSQPPLSGAKPHFRKFEEPIPTFVEPTPSFRRANPHFLSFFRRSQTPPLSVRTKSQTGPVFHRLRAREDRATGSSGARAARVVVSRGALQPPVSRPGTRAPERSFYPGNR